MVANGIYASHDDNCQQIRWSCASPLPHVLARLFYYVVVNLLIVMIL